MAPLTILVVGAGARGRGYATIARTLRCKVVGVAEPNVERQAVMAAEHGVSSDRLYASWEDACAVERFADIAIVATLDHQHTLPTIALLRKGYHVLLEKPMAPTFEETEEITAAAVAAGTVFAVCHVMRYTPYSTAIKKVIESGAIGDIVSVTHVEPVGFWHAAHSYVRGNWRREDQSSSKLLAKSCHDIDWLLWMTGKRCVSVASFGSLKHFRPECQPPEAENASRCLDCPYERSCAYSAARLYLRDGIKICKTWWPVNVLVDDTPTVDNITQALQEGPYGRCVYHCDNDVVDNQVVIMQLEGGATVSFSMVDYSADLCQRKTVFYGTTGELRCNEGAGDQIMLFPHLASGMGQKIEPKGAKIGGHGGGDGGLLRAFISAVRANDPGAISSGSMDSCYSHRVVFEAERARREGTVVRLD